MSVSRPYHASECDPVLRAVATKWGEKLRKARSHKREVFQKSADECWHFYTGPKTWEDLMGGKAGMEGAINAPRFRVSVNKAFELVSLFGPALFYTNPTRTVLPRESVEIPPEFFPVPDPMLYESMATQERARIQIDGMRARVIASYLNWTPKEFGLEIESRKAIVDALVKGRGCVWTELHQPPEADYSVVRSTYGSVDDLLIDPDADSIDEAKWIARRCVHPVWEVEQMYGLRQGSLRGNMESQDQQSYVSQSDDALYERKKGNTNDLIVYHKIWSKMGIGGRLSGASPNHREALEMFGDYAYIVVADDVPFPLNLGPELQARQSADEVFDAASWPIPFWVQGAWPVVPLDFHRIPNCVWPMAHLKAAIGELKFLNWATSFMAGKIRTTCRDLIAVPKSLDETMKETILNGSDQALIEIEAEHGTISNVLQILQHPNVNGDIWRVLDVIERNFDKRTGLSELLYGMAGATQIRSAEEAAIRDDNASVRPDDMAKQVETWQRAIAAREAFTARFMLKGEDVQGALGPMVAMVWDAYVATDDVVTAARQLDYTIEAGSTRRPNKAAMVSATGEAFMNLGPMLNQYAAATGDMGPINALISDWAKARDLDPSRYVMQGPPPPPPVEGPPPEGEQPPA